MVSSSSIRVTSASDTDAACNLNFRLEDSSCFILGDWIDYL